MLLSRARPPPDTHASINAASHENIQKQFPKLQDFLDKRDFVGALTLLEFQRSINQLDNPAMIPYCCFHLGDYRKALEEYKLIFTKQAASTSEQGITWLNIACCFFSMGMYAEAKDAAEKGADTNLKTRVLFHLAHKLGSEDELMKHHRELEETLENQLSLASIHYLRLDYQSSIDIYKRILLDNRLPRPNTSKPFPVMLSCYLVDLIMSRCDKQLPLVQKLMEERDYVALNVYVALCYHRLEYYDVSQEVLAVYLQAFPDSAIAMNLRACNTFRLYTGSAAEKDLKPIFNILHQDEQTKHGLFSNAYDLIRHNLVVFRGGEGALQVLPKLVDVIPEARLNLIIYYLHQDDVVNASSLMKEMKPKTIPELILFAIINVLLHQQHGNKENLAVAQNYYNRIGSSESEHDSVFGRLCMASAHFLNSNFDHCILYLNSVRTHYYNDDTFNFNFAQATAMTNKYAEAEALFSMIQNEKIRSDFTYVQWLARCYIMNKKPRLAWELYERMDTGSDSFQLLQLIANECYRMGQFYYAAKAFDILEKFEATHENWEGKRGAAAGVFQLIIAGHEPKESLIDMIQLLRNSSNPQAEKILSVMKKWAKENKLNL